MTTMEMGSYDDTEVCKLLRPFLPKKLSEVNKTCIGLYRDDGLSCVSQNHSSSEAKIKRKTVQKYLTSRT